MISVANRNTKASRTFFALLFVALLICLEAFGVLAAKQGELVGFISSVKGSADITRGKKKGIPLDGMNALRVGDLVRVRAKSSVVVNLCAVSSELEVKGEAAFTINKGSLGFKKGKAAPKGKIGGASCKTLMASAAKFDGAMSIKEDVAESIGAMSILGFTSGSGGKNSETDFDGSSKAISDILEETGDNVEKGFQEKSIEPEREEKIYKPNPVYVESPGLEVESVFSRAFITWEPVYDAAKYQVKITNVVNAVIFSTSTGKPYLMYPENADTPLTPGGWYLCEMEAFDAQGNTVSEDVFGIDVKDRAAQDGFFGEEKSLLGMAEKGVPGVYVLLGKLYEYNGLPPLAADSFEKALASDPGNSALAAHLAALKEKLQ
jgi:hypothetical protein